MEENNSPVQEAGSQTEKVNPLSKISTKIWAAIGAVVILSAVLIGFFASGGLKAATMHLLRIQGTVAVADGEGRGVPPKENLGLYSGYQVETRSDSFAWIDLDKVKLTKMDQNSEIRIYKEDRRLEIEVKSGSLFFNVTEPLADDETMDIRTSTMLVGIRGTCGWVLDDGRKGSQVFLLEGTVEAEALDTGETVEVSAGEMARVSVNEEGETEITVQPFAEEYIPDFVQSELEEDEDLSDAVLEASGLDVLDPPDPEERLREDYQEIINNHPILDRGAGSSYTADGVVYSNEGLSYAVTLDMNGDGSEELVLVTQQGAFLYPGPVTRLEVYGSAMGRAVLYDSVSFDEEDYMDGEYSYRPNGFELVESNGKSCIYLSYGAQSVADEHLFTLENDTLILIEWRQGWLEGLYHDHNCNALVDGAYTVLELPAVPDNIQQKVELQRNLDSREYEDYPIYAKLADTDQDGEDEMYVLSYEFCMCDWDGAQIQTTVLESNVVYAKLIDMNQDGKEELLLVLKPDEWSYFAVVYSWSDAGKPDKKAIDIGEYPYGLNIYREKSTGEIYLGGVVNQGTVGEDSSFTSLTDSVHIGWANYNPYWDYGDLDTLTPAERAEVDAQLAESRQEWEEYQEQLNRFELVEYINTDSWEWQEALAHTVDEVRRQLMAR